MKIYKYKGLIFMPAEYTSSGFIRLKSDMTPARSVGLAAWFKHDKWLALSPAEQESYCISKTTYKPMGGK